MTDGAPILSVEGFEGPLDWLLEQARARRIDLARLSIGALVAAFEAALLRAFADPDLQAAQLARWGDWLVMAADLTVLRSRLLVVDPAARRDAEGVNFIGDSNKDYEYKLFPTPTRITSINYILFHREVPREYSS